MNVVEVTKEVKSLTSSPKEMNEADASLIADVIEDIVSLERSLNEVRWKLNTKRTRIYSIKTGQQTRKAAFFLLRGLCQNLAKIYVIKVYNSFQDRFIIISRVVQD